MERLFGIPLGTLALVLACLLALVLAAVALLAARNTVFLKLGVRNAGRRPARTGLIVVGLMLATAIISSALSTGDTVGQAVRSSALEALGRTDVVVAVRGAEANLQTRLEESAQPRYLGASLAAEVERALAGTGLADGVTPAIVETVAVVNETGRRSEPRVTLYAPDPARMDGFGEIRGPDGPVTLAELAAGQVYLNGEAAGKLEARPGDVLRLLARGRESGAEVRAIVRFRGAGTDGAALLAPLAAAQALLGVPGKASGIHVSAPGGETPGAARSEALARELAPLVEPHGLEARQEKQDALEEADTAGSTFASLFTTFGSFSIAAGILLVFLIFVMLAAERRSELGIARAIGTRRGHLVQMFVYEGVAYNLAAAAVGALLGVGVAWAMVAVLGAVMSESGLEIEHAWRVRSVVVAYALGVLLTFVVVTIAAWRVSRLNIVAAVRNLPEPSTRRSRWRRIAFPVVVLAAGGLLAQSGRSGGDATAFGLGVSALIAGAVLLLRALGLSERLAFTAGGAALVVWWLLPSGVIETLAGGELRMDFSVFIVAGLMIVVGATWTIVYNADLLVGATMALLGRVRALAPVLKMALAYPLRTRFRTGITLAMFMLVVFTLVVGATTTSSFVTAFDDVERFGGGFDVRASSVAPVPGMEAKVRADRVLGPGVVAVGSQSYVPLEARQAGAEDFEPYPLRGLDDAFLRQTTFELAATATGYGSAEEVWRALRERPGLAVVDALVAPRRSNFTFGGGEGFRLHGFYLEDGTFPPLAVAVRDPATGRELRLTVIGILRDDAPFAMAGLSTSQRTVAGAFGERALPSVYYLALREGKDAAAAAARLESRFLAEGLEAQALAEVLDEAIGASLAINRLIQGFMGLGLVVGVAALGVVSARAVVERRQQIGVLRALGFRRAMVQLAFLLESSLVALTAILAGTLLGLAVAWNVISDSRSSANYADVQLVVPWLDLALIFLAVYAVALATTLAAARRAARVAPAEALRYQ